jgi:hypothetical protein
MKLLKKYEFKYLEHTPEEVLRKLIDGTINAGMIIEINTKGNKFFIYKETESHNMLNPVFYGNLIKGDNETIIQGRFGYLRYVKYYVIFIYFILLLKLFDNQSVIPHNQRVIFTCGIYLISILLFIIYTAIYKKRRLKIIEYIKNIMN